MKIVALAGGVGGAKLADGLAQVLRPEELTVVVNTGDDFTHLGLRISPDLDSVCYALAGIENPKTGWGQVNETWKVFTLLKQMGLPDWFQIGDRDLATHIVRTTRLLEGWTLSEVTKEFCNVWGIQVKVLPMSDDSIETWIQTTEGDLPFQEYFVHRKCLPVVKGFKFIGIENSKPTPGILESIEQADAIVICPSNPWVSIGPILSLPKIRAAIGKRFVLAISPIIGGKTVKGPAAKMFSELGIEPTALAIGQHYGSIIDGIMIDRTDVHLEEMINQSGIQTYVSDILMQNREDRGRLASEVIKLISVGIR